jgi:hypothetical protein
MRMATLRDCHFSYQHEVAGADMDAEAKIVKVRRVDVDFEMQVCEVCAAGLLSSGQFVLVEETPEPAAEIVAEEPIVSLQQLIEEGAEVNAEEGEGEGDN